ncbi:MAG: hypothetical protein JST92_18820 [Deltaproteobacteria bacterium]|nr:hypothetical protein [Deltaproteobacteria bacterium]
MFVAAHLGIGSALGRRFVDARDFGWLLLGTLVPDVIDKSLYYGLSTALGRSGAQLGLISGTRTIGHSILFAVLVRLVFGPRRGQALFVGMITHLGLDVIGDSVWLTMVALGFYAPPKAGPATSVAIFFPLLGMHLPNYPYKGVAEHARTIGRTWNLFTEPLGLVCLWFQRRDLLALWARARGRAPADGTSPQSGQPAPQRSDTDRIVRGLLLLLAIATFASSLGMTWLRKHAMPVETAQQRQARQAADAQRDEERRAQVLRRWIANPPEEVQQLTGSCVSQLDTTTCRLGFWISTPLAMRDPAKLAPIACAKIPDIVHAADALGLRGEYVSRPQDHECWFFAYGRHSVIVLHDKQTNAVGLQEVQ